MRGKIMFRVALDKDIHKRLKLKSVEQDTTMQAIIERLVMDWLMNEGQLKKGRFSLRGRAKGGEPIPEADIDEVIEEFNQIGSQE